MKRASFINRKNTQIREKGRVCQNKQAHTRRRSIWELGKKRRRLHYKGHALKSQKAHAYAKKQMRWHNAGNAHNPKSLHAYIKSHMHLHKGVHAHTQRSICLRPRSGNACFKKHANTPREQMPLNMEVHAHTPRSTCAYIKEYIHLYEKEHMHLHKEVHALGQEVVMLALRNTQTRQGNRRP